jgi:hypothetical protein
LRLLFLANNDIKGIIKTIEIFVEGLRTMNYELISQSFYENGLSSGVSKDGIMTVRREHWKEMRENMIEKGVELESEKANYIVRSVNIVGNAASVIMDLNFGTNKKITESYVEFYHLLKTNDEWLIVNKIFPTTKEHRKIEK